MLESCVPANSQNQDWSWCPKEGLQNVLKSVLPRGMHRCCQESGRWFWFLYAVLGVGVMSSQFQGWRTFGPEKPMPFFSRDSVLKIDWAHDGVLCDTSLQIGRGWCLVPPNFAGHHRPCSWFPVERSVVLFVCCNGTRRPTFAWSKPRLGCGFQRPIRLALLFPTPTGTYPATLSPQSKRFSTASSLWSICESRARIWRKSKAFPWAFYVLPWVFQGLSLRSASSGGSVCFIQISAQMPSFRWPSPLRVNITSSWSHAPILDVIFHFRFDDSGVLRSQEPCNG